MKVYLLLVLTVICLMGVSEAKIFRHSVTQASLKKKPWKYLTKFTQDYGKGTYLYTIRFENVPNSHKQSEDVVKIGIPVYIDDKFNHDVLETSSNADRRSNAFGQETIKVPINGTPVTYTGYLTQPSKRHVWFYAICDCYDEIAKLNIYGLRLKIDLEIINSNGSQFSTDEEGFVWLYLTLFIGSAIFLVLNFLKIRSYQKKSETKDWPHFLVILSLTFFVLSFLLQFIHLLDYSKNGEGIKVLDLFSQIFGTAGECIITIFLLLISWGWTINYTELEDLEVYIPLSILVVIVHIIIIGLGKLTDDAHNKYHSYDGWVGLAIIIIRIGIYVYFFFGIKESYQRARNKVKDFAQQLTGLGTIYFLAFPIIVVVSYIFDPYMRLSVVTFGSLLLQVLAIVLLSYNCTSKNSGYYKISKGQTLLPSEKAD